MSTTPVTQNNQALTVSAKPPEKKDWIKITGIVIAAIAGATIAAAFFCSNGTFPKELLGGKFGVATTFTIGICVLTVGGGIFFVRWMKSKEEQQEKESSGLPAPS